MTIGQHYRALMGICPACNVSLVQRCTANFSCSNGTHGPREARRGPRRAARHGPRREVRHGTRGPCGHIMDALRSLRSTARSPWSPWSPHTLRGTSGSSSRLVPVCVTITDVTEVVNDGNSDEDKTANKGIRLPRYDGSTDKWVSWHVACRAYFRRTKREEHLLGTAQLPFEPAQVETPQRIRAEADQAHRWAEQKDQVYPRDGDAQAKIIAARTKYENASNLEKEVEKPSELIIFFAALCAKAKENHAAITNALGAADSAARLLYMTMD